jgi:hypothetical protein
MFSEQEQINEFERKFVGRKGHHSDLAKQLRRAGFSVEMDEETGNDASLSLVKLQGCWNPDGSDIVLGHVLGDSEAEIVAGPRIGDRLSGESEVVDLDKDQSQTMGADGPGFWVR